MLQTRREARDLPLAACFNLVSQWQQTDAHLLKTSHDSFSPYKREQYVLCVTLFERPFRTQLQTVSSPISSKLKTTKSRTVMNRADLGSKSVLYRFLPYLMMNKKDSCAHFHS